MNLGFFRSIALVHIIVFLFFPPGICADDSLEDLASLATQAKNLRDTGDDEGALQQYTDILTIQQSRSGLQSPLTAEALTDVGRTLYDLGRYKQALEPHEKALNIRQTIFGNNHLKTAESFEHRAQVHLMTGDYNQALTEWETTLAIRLKLLGPDHVQTALCHNGLGTVYERMGDGKHALDQYETCRTILQKNLGKNDPLIATAYHNTGSALQSLARRDEARNWHQKALNLRKRLYGNTHPDVAMSLNALGCLAFSDGEFKKALKYFNQALAIREEILGLHHPLTASSTFNKASALFAMDRFDEALVCGEKALALCDKGVFVELTWRIFDLLREIQEHQGNEAVAVVFGKMAINTIQAMRNQASTMPYALQTTFVRDKYTVYENLARILIDLGRLDEAQDVLGLLKQQEYRDFLTRDAQDSGLITSDIVFTPEERSWIEAYLKKNSQPSNPQKQDPTWQWTDTGPDIRTRGTSTTNPMVFPTIQARLAPWGDGTVLLNYLITPDRLMIILTTAQGRISRNVPISSQSLIPLID